MLQVSQSRKAVPAPFICWQCLAQFHSPSNGIPRTNWRGIKPSLSNARIGRLQFLKNTKRNPERSFGTSSRNHAVAQTDSSEHVGSLPELSNKLSISPIRERLRIWEASNANAFTPPPDLVDLTSGGETRNNLTRMADVKFEVEEEGDPWDVAKSNSASEFDERLEVGDRRGFLLPGDLVELIGSGSRQQELAIFVREFENQAQYYTMSGKWMHRSTKDVKFFVPHFVKDAELDDIRPFLPSEAVSTDLQDKLQFFSESVARDIGKPLLKKMNKFWAQTESAYQATAFKLDNAHQRVAMQDHFRYATLDEIADELLRKIAPKEQSGRFSQPVLYAVHRSLIRDEIGFQCRMRGGHRTGSQYEISSRSEVKSVSFVTKDIRHYQESKIAESRGSKPKEPIRGPVAFTNFIKKAQNLIDTSRKTRQFTPFGAIGPSSIKSQEPINLHTGIEEGIFNFDDLRYITFLESWAALRSFSLQSSLNGIGSTILRATERYDFDGVKLDQTTAWTFLQEIGAIPPWENPAAYFLRLPMVGRRVLNQTTGLEVYREDILADIRKNWGTTPVYCIDDTGAHELDDGVSVEATESPDEYWVHIHTADPCSRIDPKGTIAKTAESRAQTAYLPENVVSMLSNDYVQQNLSLAAGRPSLTFSARLNTKGDILEKTITPGIINKVIYLSPSVLSETVLGSYSSPHKTVITVGSEIPTNPPSRTMLARGQLSDTDNKNLGILHKLGQAHAAQRATRGSLSSNRLNASVSVSFEGSPWIPQQKDSSYSYHGDPTIQFEADSEDVASNSAPKVETVQNLMLLAGEIAARWCHERGIPIPFRITPLNPGLPNPGDYFRNTVLPSLDHEGNAPEHIAKEYRRLCGQVLTSSTPGIHAAIGLEMYARCTSPLRRFGDMLVHWQVEAALLEEKRTGQSLLGNTREDFLPFSKARMDEILPQLSIGEKLLSKGMAIAERTWLCKLLLRAWKFDEAILPSTFDFVVKNTNSTGDLEGVLPFFLENAVCAKPTVDIDGEIKAGDVLEVKLDSINAYKGRIDVKAIGRKQAA